MCPSCYMDVTLENDKGKINYINETVSKHKIYFY